MADTAVGLFRDTAVADAVVGALRADDFPLTGIRTVGKPAVATVDSPISTPALDFAVALKRDLRSMGASEYECEAYLDGLQHGNVLVFASGSRDQADAAIDVMNEFNALEIEEFASAIPTLPGTRVGEVGAHDIASKAERETARYAGARIFTW